MKSLQKNVFRHQHYSIEDLIACPDLPALLEWGEFRWQFSLFFVKSKVKARHRCSQVFETGLWIWSQPQREGNIKRVRKKFQEGEVNMERSVHEDVRPLPLPLAQGQAWTSRYDCHSCAKKDLENHLFIKFDQILLENDICRQNISTFTRTNSNIFYLKSEFSPALSLSSPCEASTSSCLNISTFKNWNVF